MNSKSDWLPKFTSQPRPRCWEAPLNQPNWKHHFRACHERGLQVWRRVRDGIVTAHETSVQWVWMALRLARQGVRNVTWQGPVRTWWHQRLGAFTRTRTWITITFWTVAQRMDIALRVSKEERIRAWWRVHQAERSAYWARRGYTDAQLGTNGYPHHGNCSCACCDAYWSGFAQYGHGGKLPARSTSLLGLLSPPPREELFLRVTRHSANSLEAGSSAHTRLKLSLEANGADHVVDHNLPPARLVSGAANRAMEQGNHQEGGSSGQVGGIGSPRSSRELGWAIRCITQRQRLLRGHHPWQRSH